MQPNAQGSPPIVPQALNRYAATSAGQVGVAQAEAGNSFAVALRHQAPGTAVGLVVDLAPASKLVEEQVWGLIGISYLPTRGFSGVVSRFTTSRIGRSLTRLPFGLGKKVAAKYAGRSRNLLVEMRLDKGGSLVDELLESGAVVSSRYANARLIKRWEVPVIKRGTYGALYPMKTIFKSAGVAGVIGIGFQVWDDWDNPYLTGVQKRNRALWSGGSAAVGAAIGAAVGSVVPVYGTAIGAAVGFGIGVLVELYANPRIFEWTGNIPERHLAPLP